MSALTYYRPDGMAANGHSYHANLHHYGAVCASNRWPLGTVILLTAPNGRRLRLTVCDRIGQGSDYDVDPRTFRRLEGSLRKGRGRIRVRVVRRLPKARYHSKDHHHWYGGTR